MANKGIESHSIHPDSHPSFAGNKFIGDPCEQRQNKRSEENNSGPLNGKIHPRVSGNQVGAAKNESPRILRFNRARRLAFRLINPAVGN